MTRYLLDTNIVSDLIRHPRGPLAARIADIPEDALATSSIVACELRFGARKKNAPSLIARVEGALSRLTVLPFEPAFSEPYAFIRCNLEQRGVPISATDLFIAAHALAIGATLVTDNVREFGRVEGLNVENWLR